MWGKTIVFAKMKQITLTQNKDTTLTFDKKGETYVVFFKNLSGSLRFEIVEPSIKVFIYGLYSGTKNDEFHIETIQHHHAPGSLSDLLIKGVFEDKSKFVYQGLIRLEKNAQQSHAYQKNQNLILNEGVFVDSRPYLEILANDVFCTHGSTTGKLSKDQLLYAQTKGVSNKEAERMLVAGFKQEVYDKMKHHETLT